MSKAGFVAVLWLATPWARVPRWLRVVPLLFATAGIACLMHAATTSTGLGTLLLLPLHALMLSATRLLGGYGQQTVQAAGLKVSLAGLGVLRVLMARDGLKSTELAEQAWSTPGTVTSVVGTLVRGGFVERRPDATDRRVVRLYITQEGRAVITYYVSQAAGRWRKAFDFVDSGDEAVVRRFFIQMIDHLSQLIDEGRGS